MQKHTAELWDKMQNIMERYNDHMTHTHLEFDTTLDFEKLKQAFSILVSAFPIAKSHFHNGFFKAEWREIENFDINDMVKLVETDDPIAVSEKFLCRKIDESSEPQFSVLVVRSNGKDMLNTLKNHMVMDGSDIKYMLGCVSRIYSDLVQKGTTDVAIKTGRRDEAQLLENFGKEEREIVDHLLSYSKSQNARVSFPYEKKSKKGCEAFIEKSLWPADTFLAVKKRGKELGFTVNDIIVACYYRAAFDLGIIDGTQSLGVPCMMDLRKKYLAGGDSLGMANLVSMIVCDIGADIGKDIFETTAKVKASMDKLKKNYPGLHGLPLLRGVFKYTPYALAKFLIGTFFKNPLMGISNIGILDPNNLCFDGHTPVYAYFTGSIKYPPYFQLALTTYLNEVTFTIASYGTEKDKNTAKAFLSVLDKEAAAFIKGPSLL